MLVNILYVQLLCLCYFVRTCAYSSGVCTCIETAGGASRWATRRRDAVGRATFATCSVAAAAAAAGLRDPPGGGVTPPAATTTAITARWASTSGGRTRPSTTVEPGRPSVVPPAPVVGPTTANSTRVRTCRSLRGRATRSAVRETTSNRASRRR